MRKGEIACYSVSVSEAIQGHHGPLVWKCSGSGPGKIFFMR